MPQNHPSASTGVRKRMLCILSLMVFAIAFVSMGFDALLQMGSLNLIHPSASAEACNLFEGEWLLDDDEYPLYTPGSCPFVEQSFNCFANGRPDSNYTHWRWKPFGCWIPRFNGTHFLELMRGRRMAFVGDSLSRNQLESMLCLLWDVSLDKTKVFEMQDKKISKNEKESYSFMFQDYNFSLEYYSSHFLVDEDYGTFDSFTLRLDRMHKSHVHWRHADVLIFTTGHWWTHGKTARGKNFYREGSHLYRKLNLIVAFTKAMETWAAWLGKYVNSTKTLVFLTGYSPGHFRGGKWNSGGECQSATGPIFQGSQLPRYPEKMPVLETVLGRTEFPVKLLNVTQLSRYRSDGHPSVYGPSLNTHGFQDCSHWCLPGVPDVWNELLYAMLLGRAK